MLAHPAKLWLINTDLDAAIRYRTKMSPPNHSFALAESQHHVIDPTNPRGALDDGVEDRLHVRRRPADDAEHLGRCRLMLQRLAQFCVALLEFLEQPHVLDGDNGLIGESFEKRDLFIRERTNLRAPNNELRRWERLRAVTAWPARSESPGVWTSLSPGNSVSISAARSWIWIVCRSTMARPASVPRLMAASAPNWPLAQCSKDSDSP